MILTGIIFLITCILMILSIQFVPKIKIFKLSISTYWVITLCGAICMILSKSITITEAYHFITSDIQMNPLKLLIFFLSMSFLSIFLDEVGFFKKMAELGLQKAGNSQIKLFVFFYAIISLLTIFTSNDIIILTFTPFICYFSKNAKINPLPYLFMEFIAANTWSLMFIIGNPTNIYLGTLFNITFFEYFKVLVLPTIASGIVSFILLYLLFHKSLKTPIEKVCETTKVKSPFLYITGIIHIVICILLLALSNLIQFDMWIISISFTISLSIITLIYDLIHRELNLYNVLKRLPFALIPFLLSLFILIESLDTSGIINNLLLLIKSTNPLFYTFVSAFLTPFLNNIPMTIFMGKLLSKVQSINLLPIYGTIIGSNFGAFIAPTSSLAGIMWMNQLKKYSIKVSFMKFILIGLMVAIPTLFIAGFILLFI